MPDPALERISRSAAPHTYRSERAEPAPLFAQEQP